MFFPVIKFSFQKERSRSQPPEIVPASWEAPLRPLSCQVAAPTRHSILLEDCVDDGLSEAPATLRRPSYVEPRAAPPLPPGSEVADITYIYPSRGRRGERTERRLSTQLPQPLESPEDSRYLSPRRAPIPRQELVLERPLPSGCRSCASGPSAARSTSSQRTRNAARSASIVFSSGSRRSGSSARSTTTTSSRRSASASAVSSVRTSPSLASSQTSRRSSVSTSPSPSTRSTGSFYRYRPYDDTDASTRAYEECVRGKQLDEAEKRRYRRILRVAEYAAGGR